MTGPVAARLKEQDRLIDVARDYVDRISARFSVVAAVVAGSVARGDFNLWSDIDVVLVIDDLPDRTPDRAGMLLEDAAGGVQPIGFTPGEFSAAVVKKNPIVVEALKAGVILKGQKFLTAAGSD